MQRLMHLFVPLLILVLFAAPVFAEDPYYPQLYNDFDLHMQQLAVMSQQDEVFDGIPYNNGYLTGRGCGPLSVANSLIAAFGVTDPKDGKAIVFETMTLLARNYQSDAYPIEVNKMPDLLNVQKRLDERSRFPVLGKLIYSYPGQIHATSDTLDAQTTIDMIDTADAPALLSGRMYVNHTWEDVVRILLALHERGYDDATLALAYAGAGLETSTAPLRSGASGHYLTLLLHVGSFINSGAIYVLDSLPRALSGEPCGYQSIYRNAYAFPLDDPENSFNVRYRALRISPTVIKLTLSQRELTRLEALATAAAIAPKEVLDAVTVLRTRQLAPLMIYGSCSMLISLPAPQES